MSEKNQLQEYYQKRGLPVPTYRFEERGFDHQREYRSNLILENRKFISPWCSKKKDSEKECARLALEYLREHSSDPQDNKTPKKNSNINTNTTNFTSGNSNSINVLLSNISGNSSSSTVSNNLNNSINSSNSNNSTTTTQTTTLSSNYNNSNTEFNNIKHNQQQTKLISSMSPYDFHKLFNQLEIEGQLIMNYHEVAHLVGQDDGFITVEAPDNSQSAESTNSSSIEFDSGEKTVSNTLNTDDLNSLSTTKTTTSSNITIMKANLPNPQPNIIPYSSIISSSSSPLSSSSGSSFAFSPPYQFNKEDILDFPPIKFNSQSSDSPQQQPRTQQTPVSKLKDRVKEIESWGVDKVIEWLKSTGELSFLIDIFQENEITGSVLLEIEKNDYNELGINSFSKKKIWEKHTKLLKSVDVSEESLIYAKMGIPPPISNTLDQERRPLITTELDAPVPALTGTIDPRDYQIKMYKDAMREDSIVCIPTGLGKTLIGCMVLKRMTELNRNKKALFIVDRIPLVEQQSQVIFNNTGLIPLQAVGDRFKVQRLKDKYDVLVIIGALLINLVKSGNVDLEDYCVFLFDEAHHITKEHPFSYILRTYVHHLQPRPKILGLTASPAGKESLFQTIIAIRTIMIISKSIIIKPTESSIEKYINPCHTETLHIPQTTIESNFIQFIKHVITKFGLPVIDGSPIYDLLNSEIIPGNFATSIYFEQIGQVDQFINAISNKIHQYRLIGSFAGYAKGDINRPKTAREFIEKRIMKIIKNGEVQRILLHLMESNIPDTTFNYDNQSKLDKALEILKKFSSDLNLGFRAILFTKTRASALQLSKVLSDLSESIPEYRFIKPGWVVGHEGMSVSQQKRTIEQFRDGRCNVIVSTSVVEEGFDVPDCNLVIRMDPPTSITALIQSRGRLRNKLSYLYFLVKDGERNIYENFMKQEQFLKESIEFLVNNIHPPSLRKIAQTSSVSSLNQTTIPINFSAKMMLEEFCSKIQAIGIPINIDFSENRIPSSPDHSPIYRCKATLNESVYESSGNSKKQARENVSLIILNNFVIYNFLKLPINKPL